MLMMMLIPGLDDKPPLVILLLDDGCGVVVVGPGQVADVGPGVRAEGVDHGLGPALGAGVAAQHVHHTLAISLQ